MATPSPPWVTRYVSFDIGIRHMAYCVLCADNPLPTAAADHPPSERRQRRRRESTAADADDSPPPYSVVIERWEVVDILAQPGTMYDSAVEHILCKSWKVAQLRAYLKARGVACDGKRTELLKRVAEQASAAAKVTCYDSSMIGSKLFAHFEGCAWLEGCDVALLENQPCLTNPTMKSVQVLLFGYLLHRCQYVPHRDGRGKRMTLRLVSARRKSNLFDSAEAAQADATAEETVVAGDDADEPQGSPATEPEPESEPSPCASGRKRKPKRRPALSYKQRKAQAIATVRTLLDGADGAQSWIDKFQRASAKARDDLSDCLLQGLQVIGETRVGRVRLRGVDRSTGGDATPRPLVSEEEMGGGDF